MADNSPLKDKDCSHPTSPGRYDYGKLKALALEAIRTHDLINAKEIAAFLPCSRRTIDKNGLMKDDDIVDEIYRARVTLKSKMRRNWQKEDAAAPLQLAAFKLMSDDDEWERLGSHKQSRVDSQHTVSITVNFGESKIESDPIDATSSQLAERKDQPQLAEEYTEYEDVEEEEEEE